MNRDKYLKYKRKYLELKESLLKGGFFGLKSMSPESQILEKKSNRKNAEKQSEQASKQLILSQQKQQQHTIYHGPYITPSDSVLRKDRKAAEDQILRYAQATKEKKAEDRKAAEDQILRDAQTAKEKKAKQKAWDDASIFGKAYIVVDSFVRTISPIRR
jgi:hypothetical protein